MTEIAFRKPPYRWLFGGFGFHNSEATMLPLMQEKFRDEHALKSFRELRPTFSRVFAGYADWSKEAMDSFADFYDIAYRNAGTLVYLAPGRIPMFTKDFELYAYCEKVASNLDYLVNTRKCKKLRWYCVTNELSCGNTYAYLSEHRDLLKKLNTGLAEAFRRHGLGIGLLGTDCSGKEAMEEDITWAIQEMDEWLEGYCSHLYLAAPDNDRGSLYDYVYDCFSPLVQQVLKKEKRLTLGEFGINAWDKWQAEAMRDDVSLAYAHPEYEAAYALDMVEFAMGAINAGCLSAAMWTMIDYPDPLLCEDGDTPAEHAAYDAVRFSGHGLSIRYNKNGLVAWCDEEHDYHARAAYYSIGWMARLFRKGGRLLKTVWQDKEISASGITNADGSVSLAIVNRGRAKHAVLKIDHPALKAYRLYEFRSDAIPYHPCGDLQPPAGLIIAEKGQIELELSA